MIRNEKKRQAARRFESLERRNPLAGNVTAAVVGGTLMLEGDSGENAVQVRQLSESSWEVRGLDTRINGSNSAFIANGVLAGISADLNRGDDFIKIFNGTIAADLVVETNQGADALQFINLNVNGIANVTTGDDNDSVLVSDVEVNGTVESETPDTGAFRLLTHGGSDVVNVDRLLATSAYINLGSGNDSLAMTRSSFDFDLRIRASDGTDAVSLNDIDAEEDIWVHMGDGDSDALSVANSSGAAGIFRGGNGDGDSLSRSDNNFGAEIENDFEFVS
jgi:hypothetical protein